MIGWLQWGGPSTALQAGIIVSIQGAQWKVQDVSRRDSSKLRLIKEVGRFQAKEHVECFVAAAHITPSMHEAKWYPVFSAYGPQRSPRRFFQQPEGCMNLFLDPRFTKPTVRVHTDAEVWRLIHFGIPSHMQQIAGEVAALCLAYRQADARVCSRGSDVQTTQWIMQHLAHRLEAYARFMRSKWPQPLQTKHIDSAGMVTDTKRVVMLVCTQHPAPAVLLSHDHAVLCTDIQDASRAHNSALEVCVGWATALGLQLEPVLIGPVTLSTLGAAVLVFAAPIPSSDDPLPASLTADTAVWTQVDALRRLLQSVTEVAFAKLASFMGPSQSMSVLFSSDSECRRYVSGLSGSVCSSP